MRLFVAGASGVIGRRLVPLLVAQGHTVTGMTRSQDKATQVREAGAEPAICDVYDGEALARTVAATQPEVLVHELTDLPPDLDPRRAKEAYARNDRVRREGTRNLMDAAARAGVRRVVAQSVAFAYRPEGDLRKAEEAPLWDDAPAPFTDSVAALHALEDVVTGTAGIEGLVLRYGFFYGPGSSYAAGGHIAGQVRKRRFPVLGQGSGVFSFIHVDDAAAATAAAVERGAPGIYNVVDDEPAPIREWLPEFAGALGAKRPMHAPAWLGRLLAGRFTAAMATDLRGASNDKAKRELGWQPRYASWRQGFREALG